MGFLDTVNQEKTIQDIDFTELADAGIKDVIESEDFLYMDAEMIFNHLLSGIRQMEFSDHLKRYVYEKEGMTRYFYEVPDEEYHSCIQKSFEKNGAPFSLTPTTKRKGAIIRGWLKSETVRRSTIFALGFGLGMTRQDVTRFLTKVIREEDINWKDPLEAIYAYCYSKAYPYVKAYGFIREYEEMSERAMSRVDDERWFAMLAQGEPEIKKDRDLRKYLAFLRKKEIAGREEAISYRAFIWLLDRTRQLIVKMYNTNYVDDSGQTRRWTPADIGFADVEKVICSGIPVNKSGNLKSMKSSRLAKRFHNQRMSRQRLSMIYQRKQKVERFDLITLLFFIYSQEAIDELPVERCRKYMEEINRILRECHMTAIYSVNPYEAFILLCLLTDFPLDVYADIWEMSYQD